MKKILSVMAAVAASFMMVSCASISFNNTVYVEGTESFEATDLVITKLGTNFACGEYNASFSGVKTDKSGFAIMGVGKTTETSTVTGTFNKGTEKLFNSNITSTAEQWGASSGNSKDVWGSATVSVVTGKKAIAVPVQKDDDGYILRDESVCPIAIQVVQSYKTESGKTYKLPATQFAGAKVYIGNELYGLVDLISNSPKMYTNPSFSRKLSDEEKDLVMSYMFLTVKVCKYFK